MNDMTRGSKYGISVMINSRVQRRIELVSFMKFCNVEEEEDEEEEGGVSTILFLVVLFLFFERNSADWYFEFLRIELLVTVRDDSRTNRLLDNDGI
jgi:hypothetical protein